MDDELYDCIVVGAGPAGLSAALFLARYCHRTVVFHHNSPRNLYSHGVHGFLGHHGIQPRELLARGRDEVRQHGGVIVEACVTNVKCVAPEHFRVAIDDWQSFGARRLLLATGLRDLTPDCPGFREFYGRSVFHCPDCDGFEVAGKRVVVLGRGKKTTGFTLGLLTWTNWLSVITDSVEDEMNAEERTKLADFNIPILKRRIARLEGDSETGQLKRVRFEEGDALACDALFFNLGIESASNLHTLLGCQLDQENGLVWIDHQQQTSVPNVYAAGDLTPCSQLAVVAAAEGAMAAIQIHKSLLPPERCV
jgi:thioredoxin reductase